MARETKEFSAHVPTNEYEEFKANFPQYGAVNWFINSSLTEFNRIVRENPTAKQQIVQSIEAMLQLNRLAAEAEPAATTA